MNELLNKYKYKDVCIYAETEIIEDMIYENELVINNQNVDMKSLFEENDCLLLSKLITAKGEVWFLEELFHKNGEQVYNETDVALIDESVIEELELKKIEADEIIAFCNDCKGGLDEDLDEYFDTLVEDVFADIENGECISCAIKKSIMKAYETGREDVIEELVLNLDED